jgi:guanine deaminase
VRGAVLAPASPARLAFWPDGVVAWDGTGTIRHVGPAGACAARVKLLDPGAPAVIGPGLVDVHVHLPQLALRGRNPGPLLAWLAHEVFPAEAALAAADAAQSAARAFDRALLAAGTTAAGVYVTVHERAAAIALATLRVRGLVGPVLMDRGAPAALLVPAIGGIAATERLLAAHPGRVAVTPRFAVSASPALLAAAGVLARVYRAPIMTHLAENAQETALVRKLFPKARSYTAVYAAAGLLTPRTILAHAIHLDDDDWRTLARTRAAVAHCPTANRALGSGRLRLERLRAHGVRYALGTDVGAGPSLSLWHVVDACLTVHRRRAAVTPAEAYHRATVAGGELLGISSGLRPGRPADLAVFRRPPRVPPAAGGEGLVRALAAATRDEPEPTALLTVIGGRVVHAAPGLDADS